jgi:trimeric autotransporter adhesin
VFSSKTNTTDLDTRSTVKAAKKAQANAAKSAQNAAAAAQNAAALAQTAAQNAAAVATSKVQDASNAVQSAAGSAQAAAQNAAAVAASKAQTASGAAQNASDAAQNAATVVTQNVKDKVFVARKWAAPRLESAADYTTNTVAPKVSSALRSTAQQVKPVEPKRNVLKWSMLAAGILAGVGAAAVLVRFRFRAAIAADSETADEEVLGDSTGSQAAPISPDATADTTDAADPGADSSANGRVKANGGW